MDVVATAKTKCQHDKWSCVVVNVAFLINYTCIIYILAWSVFEETQRSKLKFSKQKVCWKRKFAYTKHMRIKWCHMYVIFMPNHLLWKRRQYVHIFSMIIHCHTRNVYCNAVITFHVSIFLTKKQIISIQIQHLQYSFTFITSLRVELLMVEFKWNTEKYVASLNNNLQQTNLQKYTP